MAFPVLCCAASTRPRMLLIGGMRTVSLPFAATSRCNGTRCPASATAGSIDLEIDRLDDGRPARDLALDHGAEFRWRVADRLHQLGRELFARVGRLDCVHHLVVDSRDHGAARLGWP